MHATLTGAKPLAGLSWKPYRIPPHKPRPPTSASFLVDENNVYGVAQPSSDSPGIKYLGNTTGAEVCQGVCNASASCQSWTWHPDTKAMAGYATNCFGRTTDFWHPQPQNNGITSGRRERPAPLTPPSAQNGWVADVSAQLPVGSEVYGLRVGGRRAIRARFPNADPETASSFPPWVDNGYGGMRANHGWLPWKGSTAKWMPPPAAAPSEDLTSAPEDWPGVEWPSKPIGLNAPQTGSGNWGTFTMGTGGQCAVGLPGTYTPPYGYYCSNKPPRGSAFKHSTPIGLDPGAELPNGPYKNVSAAVVQSWMPEHWYSNQYLVGSQQGGGGYGGRGFVTEPETQALGEMQQQRLPHVSGTRHSDAAADDAGDAATSTVFSFASGGYQGSIGTPEKGTSGEWYIENVIEELDAPTEWFYDTTTAKLYYIHNASVVEPPSASLEFEAVTTKVLLNFSGTQSQPLTDVSVKGMTLRDTAYTYLDPHGAPSGGDWAIQRTGAVTITGTVGAVLESSLFTRLDGLGVFISGYNRNLTIQNSTFEWLGGSAMASCPPRNWTPRNCSGASKISTVVIPMENISRARITFPDNIEPGSRAQASWGATRASHGP
jgi:hypothetical protein